MEQRIIEKFLCNICFKTYPDLKTALSCCIQREITPLFECSLCGSQYCKNELCRGCCNNNNTTKAVSRHEHQ